MASNSERRGSSSELLHELEALSQTPFQSNPNRRNASLILDRSSIVNNDATRSDRGSQSHRLPLPLQQSQVKNRDAFQVEPITQKEKKGIWSWRPLRALSHVRMQRTRCLFHVKAVAIKNLPDSTNGLRLRVSVRKKETKEGTVCTVPARVTHGSAEFDETLFVQCHLYRKGKLPVFEPRVFLISVAAVDAPEINLGTNGVDLSLLVKESIVRSFEGVRVQEWGMNFELSGKAKGGRLVLKLGFQISEEGGVSIYSQAGGLMRKNKEKYLYPSSSELKVEDVDGTKFEIVEMGIGKVAERQEGDEAKSREKASKEVVKEVVHHRMMELESIAKQIKDLESPMIRDESDDINIAKRKEALRLDVNEETVTRKFLHMLDLRDDEESNEHNLKTTSEIETRVIISNLGKCLGPVVQSRDGGYLVSMNVYDIKVENEENPKLTMQISRPFILKDPKQDSGLEVFRRLASTNPQELTSKLSSLMAMDELMGKTAEQVAFEGIASAIINGRNKEGASICAARSIATTKMMASVMTDKNSQKDPTRMEEILAISMQTIGAMVGEGLRIQAEMAEEEAPFDISNFTEKVEEEPNNILDSSISLEEWESSSDDLNGNVKLLVTIQPRDPIRRFEPVGGLQVALVDVARTEIIGENEEARLKVTGIHVGGLKLKSEEGQRQRVGALQWFVGAGLCKTKKNKMVMEATKGKETMWSLSSPLMEDVWLKPTRNPNVKFL